MLIELQRQMATLKNKEATEQCFPAMIIKCIVCLFPVLLVLSYCLRLHFSLFCYKTAANIRKVASSSKSKSNMCAQIDSKREKRNGKWIKINGNWRINIDCLYYNTLIEPFLNSKLPFPLNNTKNAIEKTTLGDCRAKI